jgi:hypothetical protein
MRLETVLVPAAARRTVVALHTLHQWAWGGDDRPLASGSAYAYH